MWRSWKTKTLRALTDLIPDRQAAVLQKAVADALIPLWVSAQIPAILVTLQRIKLRYVGQIAFGGGKGTVAQLLDLTPARDEQGAFLAAFAAHTGPMSDFWSQLVTNNVLPAETVEQVKLTFGVGALTRNHIPLVRELLVQLQSGQIRRLRDLAALDRADWIALFERPGPDGEPIGVPDNVDGATPQAKREQFAAILDRQLQRAYPTASFAAKLARAREIPLQRRAGHRDLSWEQC